MILTLFDLCWENADRMELYLGAPKLGPCWRRTLCLRLPCIQRTTYLKDWFLTRKIKKYYKECGVFVQKQNKNTKQNQNKLEVNKYTTHSSKKTFGKLFFPESFHKKNKIFQNDILWQVLFFWMAFFNFWNKKKKNIYWRKKSFPMECFKEPWHVTGITSWKVSSSGNIAFR